MKRFLCVFCLLFSTLCFCSEKAEFGTGIGISLLAPEFNAELTINHFDIDLSAGGFVFPVFSYDDDGTQWNSGYTYRIIGKIGCGYKGRIADSGNMLGGGIYFLTYYNNKNTYYDEAYFVESCRAYFKYSYRFKFGLELSAKAYFPLFGFGLFNSDGAPIWYLLTGEFWMGASEDLLPTLEVKYFF